MPEIVGALDPREPQGPFRGEGRWACLQRRQAHGDSVADIVFDLPDGIGDIFVTGGCLGERIEWGESGQINYLENRVPHG